MKLLLDNSLTFPMEKINGTREGRQKKKTLGTPEEIGKPKSKPEEFEVPIEPRRDKIGSPAFLPPGERKHYDKITGLEVRFLRRLTAAWNSFKRDYLGTIEKQRITSDQRDLFEALMDDFNGVAEDAFAEGVSAGNNYFEDQFSAIGLNPGQQRRVVRQHTSVFKDRAKTLFFTDVVDKLGGTPPEQQEKILNGFDRFLLGYAAVSAAIAYDVFLRNITGLNKSVFRSLTAAGRVVPPDVIQVRWVLFEDSEHSQDCLKLSEGEEGDGSGLWNAETLSEMGFEPRSPNLDCGGNCNCHLSPIIPTPEGFAGWFTNATPLPTQRDVLDVRSDIGQTRLLSFFISKNFTIPANLADDVVKRKSFRRRAFWSVYPNNGIVYNVSRGAEFRVGGSTNFTEGGKLLGTRVNITLGPGQQISTLGKAERDLIAQVLGHEVGHTFASLDAAFGPTGFGVHGIEAAQEVMRIAARERKIVLAKIGDDFRDTIEKIPKDRVAELRDAIQVTENFLRNPEDFIDDLFKAVGEGGTFGGVSAEDAWLLLNRALHQFTSGTQLIRSYQLWNPGEYFADWFGVLLTDPSKAALYSPRLNKVMAQRFPRFFKKAGARRIREFIPDAVAATFRTDLPLGSGFVPIAPNLKSISSAAARFESSTKRIATSTVQREISAMIKATPNLHRQEFYRGLNVNFLDKLQTANRTGSRRTLAFIDKKDQFFVNYDRWRLLSNQSKSTVVSDIIARHVWKTARPSIRTRIREIYTNYLGNTLNFLENKADIQRLARRPIQEIREITLGNRAKNRARNLGFWGRNFQDGIKPALDRVTDLPILNVDSLASPQAYWSEWLKLYMTNPSVSNVYSPLFKTVLEDFLRTSRVRKFFDLLIEERS